MSAKAKMKSKMKAKIVPKREDIDVDSAWDTNTDEEIEEHPFRFFDLPYELRLRVYELALLLPNTIDLDPANYYAIAPLLRLFFVSHRMHDEAARIFYGSNTFRVLPIHGRFFHTKAPLLARFPSHYRAHITKLELRLGPGWTKPPRGWVVDERHGLQDTRKTKLLKVFIEHDPESHPCFEGFGIGPDFFTDFSTDLVRSLFAHVPSVAGVEFDAWDSVQRSTPLLQALLTEVKAHNKRVTWGPQRGWDRTVDVNLADVLQNLTLTAP